MKEILNYFDRDVIHSTKEIEAPDKDALFEKFLKLNDKLRYCNGSYYMFQNKDINSEYNQWKKTLSKDRSYSLFYGTYVD